jgi:hypothetical protein
MTIPIITVLRLRSANALRPLFPSDAQIMRRKFERQFKRRDEENMNRRRRRDNARTQKSLENKANLELPRRIVTV